MNKIKLILAASILLVSGQVGAALIEQDWLVTGDELITYNTETRLEWLDVTVTQGMSYNETLNFLSLGIGDAYDGWLLAGSTDISQFWLSAGIEPFFDGTTLNKGAVGSLIDS